MTVSSPEESSSSSSSAVERREKSDILNRTESGGKKKVTKNKIEDQILLTLTSISARFESGDIPKSRKP